jgi:hypothetical protein
MLKPLKVLVFSTNFLNCSKVTFYSSSEASSKLSLSDPYFFERIRPICWIADSFQSKVLVCPKLPPKDLLNLSDEAVLEPLVEYGLVSLSSLWKSESWI